MAHDSYSPASGTEGRRPRSMAWALLPGIIAIVACAMALDGTGSSSAPPAAAVAQARPETAAPMAINTDNIFVPSSFAAVDVLVDAIPDTF